MILAASSYNLENLLFFSFADNNSTTQQNEDAANGEKRQRPISRKSLADLHLHILKEMHGNKGPDTFQFDFNADALMNGMNGVPTDGRRPAGGVMRVDGSGVTHVGARPSPASPASADTKKTDSRPGDGLWEPLGVRKSGGLKSERVNNHAKLTPLNISHASNYQV